MIRTQVYLTEDLYFTVKIVAKRENKPAAQVIREKALIRFEKSAKGVSFTDCLVMAFADEYKTNLIFGFDDVFSKCGYQNP
jgi:predicted nucleic acid-binding protein